MHPLFPAIKFGSHSLPCWYSQFQCSDRLRVVTELYVIEKIHVYELDKYRYTGNKCMDVSKYKFISSVWQGNQHEK